MADRTQWVIFGGGAALLLWLYSQTQAGESVYGSLFGPGGGSGGAGGTPTPKPTGGGGDVLADIGKAVGAVGTVVGVGKAAVGFLAPKTAEAAPAYTVGQSDVMQGVKTALEKGGMLFVSEIPGVLGMAGAEAAIAGSGGLYSGGVAVTASEIAGMTGSELGSAIAAGAIQSGAVVGAETASLYSGLTAATLADISGAVGAAGAASGEAAAAGGAASAAGASVGVAAGLVAIPFLVLAAVNMVEQAKVAAQLAESGAMVKPIFDALTVNGPSGAAAWLAASGGWANTGRDNNYLQHGMRVLDMLAFPDAKAENPWLTDRSQAPWEAAGYSMMNAVTNAQGVSSPVALYIGVRYFVTPAPKWYLGILQSGRYPARADYERLTLADLDQAALAIAQQAEARYVDWGTPEAFNPFTNPFMDTGR